MQQLVSVSSDLHFAPRRPGELPDRGSYISTITSSSKGFSYERKNARTISAHAASSNAAAIRKRAANPTLVNSAVREKVVAEQRRSARGEENGGRSGKGSMGSEIRKRALNSGTAALIGRGKIEIRGGARRTAKVVPRRNFPDPLLININDRRCYTHGAYRRLHIRIGERRAPIKRICRQVGDCRAAGMGFAARISRSRVSFRYGSGDDLETKLA